MLKKTFPLCTLALCKGLVLNEAVAATQEETLVVTASGFQQKIEDAPASISVLDGRELEKRAYYDITDALKDVPGVVITGGASSSDISLRGMSSNYTLILVDGKRVNSRGTRPNSDGAGIEQGWLPPLAAIDRIEVIRGPMSSLYGSDAMGGVINIITRKISTQDQWLGSLSASATLQERSDSGDQLQSSVYASGPLIENLLGLRVSGLFSRRAEDRIINGYNEQKMRSGTANFRLTPDDKNDFDLEISRSLQDRNSRPGRSSSSANPSINQYQRTNYSLTHDGHYDFATTQSYIQHEINDNPGRSMRFKQTLFNSQMQMSLGDHNITGGGQYRYESLDDNSSNSLGGINGVNQLTRWSGALFAEDEWALTNDFAFTTGLRLEQDQNYGRHITPKGYGVWHLSETLTLKGGVSAGYRAPDLRASSPNWGQVTGGGRANGVIRGNSDLQPEKSLSQEIGLLWNNAEGFNTGLTLFNTDFKNKITEIRTCDQQSPEPCMIGDQRFDFISDRVNVDKANMRGVEGLFEWQITPDWRWATTYTFTQTKQKSGVHKGKPLNKMPSHMLNSTLDWQATPSLNLWSRVNFRSKSREYLSRTSIAEGTPAYSFIDSGVNYQATKQLKLNAGIYNLLDKRVDNDIYGTTLDGRRYNIGLIYDF